MQLMKNDFISIEFDASQRLVRFTRTKNRYPLNEQTKEVLHKINETFEHAGREKNNLLVDMREAPLRNDEQFESFGADEQAHLFAGFAKVAILVKTAVGELQFARLKRENRVSATNAHVFRDEAAALAYLNDQTTKAAGQ